LLLHNIWRQAPAATLPLLCPLAPPGLVLCKTATARLLCLLAVARVAMKIIIAAPNDPMAGKEICSFVGVYHGHCHHLLHLMVQMGDHTKWETFAWFTT